MFESLQKKFLDVIRNVRGMGKITDKNVRDIVRQMKLSLLEADVNYKVVKAITNNILEKARGEKVLNSITPAQQFVKIVYDELVSLLGSKEEKLRFIHRPSAVMLVGLQGSGKTTTAAKLALLLKEDGKRAMLVAADIYRPAAVEQLKILGREIGVKVFSEENKQVIEICKDAMKEASSSSIEIVLFDTAGRLHIDEGMMKELEDIKRVIKPDERLLVLDAMTGQDAVNVAVEFDKKLDITGIILSKLDGDARGGAALSVRYVTGKPVKFIGVSEKIKGGIEQFYPDRIASRILDMGDVVTLVEKVQKVAINEKSAAEFEKRLMHSKLTLQDFLNQMKEIKKMGGVGNLVDLIPGNFKRGLKTTSVDEGRLKQMEAIINSMTSEERSNTRILNASRKKRIARGSGTTVADVNRLLGQYQQAVNMMKKFMKDGKSLKKMRLPF